MCALVLFRLTEFCCSVGCCGLCRFLQEQGFCNIPTLIVNYKETSNPAKGSQKEAEKNHSATTQLQGEKPDHQPIISTDGASPWKEKHRTQPVRSTFTPPICGEAGACHLLLTLHPLVSAYKFLSRALVAHTSTAPLPKGQGKQGSLATPLPTASKQNFFQFASHAMRRFGHRPPANNHAASCHSHGETKPHFKLSLIATGANP